MTARDIIEQALEGVSLPSTEAIFPKEPGETPEKYKVRETNTLGHLLDRVGLEMFNRINKETNLNVESKKMNFQGSGAIELPDGTIIRGVFAKYNEDTTDYNRVELRDRASADYITERNSQNPEYYLLKNTLYITPTPEQEIKDGVILLRIEQYDRLPYITDPDTSEKILDLDKNILGIPTGKQSILIEGLMSKLYIYKKEINISQVFEQKFQQGIEEAISEIKYRAGTSTKLNKRPYLPYY